MVHLPYQLVIAGFLNRQPVWYRKWRPPTLRSHIPYPPWEIHHGMWCGMRFFLFKKKCGPRFQDEDISSLRWLWKLLKSAPRKRLRVGVLAGCSDPGCGLVSTGEKVEVSIPSLQGEKTQRFSSLEWNSWLLISSGSIKQQDEDALHSTSLHHNLLLVCFFRAGDFGIHHAQTN